MDHTNSFTLRWADAGDADIVAELVLALLIEIWQPMPAASIDHDLVATAHTARRWLEQGHYQALLAFHDGVPLGVITVAQSHALHAGGTIGVIQEFFVVKQARSLGLGSLMLQRVRELARRRGWHALDLCSPPEPRRTFTLPHDPRTTSANGFVAKCAPTVRSRVSLTP